VQTQALHLDKETPDRRRSERDAGVAASSVTEALGATAGGRSDGGVLQSKRKMKGTSPKPQKMKSLSKK
jgi:hypothetical protein